MRTTLHALQALAPAWRSLLARLGLCTTADALVLKDVAFRNGREVERSIGSATRAEAFRSGREFERRRSAEQVEQLAADLRKARHQLATIDPVGFQRSAWGVA